MWPCFPVGGPGWGSCRLEGAQSDPSLPLERLCFRPRWLEATSRPVSTLPQQRAFGSGKGNHGGCDVCCDLCQTHFNMVFISVKRKNHALYHGTIQNKFLDSKTIKQWGVLLYLNHSPHTADVCLHLWHPSPEKLWWARRYRHKQDGCSGRTIPEGREQMPEVQKCTPG